jgi:hypothetical protein
MPETPIDHEGQDFVAPDESQRVEDPELAEKMARATDMHRTQEVVNKKLRNESWEKGDVHSADQANSSAEFHKREAEKWEDIVQTRNTDGEAENRDSTSTEN